MPVDLTVFNGEDHKPADWDTNHLAKSGPWDPDDDNPNADAGTPAPGTVAFGSRERGLFSKYLSSDDNLWTIWGDRSNVNTLGGEDPPFENRDSSLTNVHFQFMLNDISTVVTNKGNASLGFLNHSYGLPMYNSDPRVQAVPANPPAEKFPRYQGDPNKPFPWLAWNNRPYNSVGELMMVPASHPGRFMFEFSKGTQTAIAVNPYVKDFVNASPKAERLPFGHLLNFFRTPTSTTPNAPSLAPILDYLQVPSPFVGTETVLNPQKFAGNWWGSGKMPGEAPSGNEPTGTAGLHPPFDIVSNYRDPGRVNINTIPATTSAGGMDVWNAVLGGDSTDATYGTQYGPQVSNLIASRAGYGGSTSYKFDSSGTYPSLFSNPFRSASAGDMVPQTALAVKPVNATLLRADGAINIIANPKIPLLTAARPITPNPASNSPANAANSFNDYQRNAYFYFQPFDRLASKVTTRSNVYAVWVTVGYFEVSPWYGYPASPGGPYPTSGAVKMDAAHPDGYQLGQELGADTGEIERHRGFFIIDRSIPVGFQRGQDINANETVILKRFIE